MVKTRRVSAAAVPSRRFCDLVGLALFFTGAACLFWLAWSSDALLPHLVTNGLRLLAGSGAFIVPILIMFIGTLFLIGYERLSFSHSAYGSLLLFLAFVTWRHIAWVGEPLASGSPEKLRQVMDAGGYLGGVLGTLFLRLLGTMGSYLILLMMVCMAIVLLVDRPFIELIRALRGPAEGSLSAAKESVAVVRERTGAIRENRAEKLAKSSLRGDGFTEAEEREPTPKRHGLLSFRREKMTVEEPTEEEMPPAPVRGFPVDEPDEIPPVAAKEKRETAKSAPKEEVTLAAPAAPGEKQFVLPPLSLLKEAPPAAPKKAQQELADKIRVLEQTLDQFGIGANVVEIAHGPTITRYEIQLAPGIKVSKIVSLADNLAMAMAAIDVRVEAPIPGKSAIGIEVPNATTTLVTLRDVIDVPEFKNAPSKLLFALGKDVSGVNRYADLTKMPHLLIGGSTNSGKSVCLNVLIASMLYRATPRELQFLMIDPKRVELSLWEGIPHLMHPVVTDVKQAPGLFRAALKEMERRYDMFSRIGTRNIDGWNQRMVAEGKEDDKLPYLVIVVDELADLMMQSAAEVETSICRLAQLARATGIHLVIATQRPSVDVITGLIKANISSRIAFAVSSQVDSRTILDMSGAERLIGRGDMLFLPIDASKPSRIQGCYLSEQETNALVDYLKEQEKPNYTITLPDATGSGSQESAAEDSDDELYEPAVRLVVTNGQASTSMLQRRFKIGYTRAARLVDIMEQKGIVGALDGAKPREILVSKDEIDRMFHSSIGEEAGIPPLF